jgi:hypothetical protein
MVDNDSNAQYIFAILHSSKNAKVESKEKMKKKRTTVHLRANRLGRGGWLGLGVEIFESPLETSMGGKFQKSDDLLRKLRLRPSMSRLKKAFAHEKKFFCFAVECTGSSREGIANGRFYSHAELFKMVRRYPRCYLLWKWGEGRTLSRSSFTWCIVSIRNHQGRPEADRECRHGLGHGCETVFDRSVFIVCVEDKMIFTERLSRNL